MLKTSVFLCCLLIFLPTLYAEGVKPCKDNSVVLENLCKRTHGVWKNGKCVNRKRRRRRRIRTRRKVKCKVRKCNCKPPQIVMIPVEPKKCTPTIKEVIRKKLIQSVCPALPKAINANVNKNSLVLNVKVGSDKKKDKPKKKPKKKRDLFVPAISIFAAGLFSEPEKVFMGGLYGSLAWNIKDWVYVEALLGYALLQEEHIEGHLYVAGIMGLTPPWKSIEDFSLLFSFDAFWGDFEESSYGRRMIFGGIGLSYRVTSIINISVRALFGERTYVPPSCDYKKNDFASVIMMTSTLHVFQ